MTGKKPHTEPSADLRMLAVALWQQYVAMREAGFSEDQALTIIGHTIAAGITAAARAEDEE